MGLGHTYTLLVLCSNCHTTSRVEITRGKLLRQAKCPTCGCNGVLNVTEGTRWNAGLRAQRVEAI